MLDDFVHLQHFVQGRGEHWEELRGRLPASETLIPKTPLGSMEAYPLWLQRSPCQGAPITLMANGGMSKAQPWPWLELNRKQHGPTI